MRRSLLLVAIAAFAVSVYGQAGRAGSPVLVELFTSQGCSSCPPADKLLGELAERPDVVALAYHVDYWDYLGWKDTFAQPAFSERQRSYSSRVDRQYIKRRLRGSFTPEIVVQGSDSLIGSAAPIVTRRIEAHAAAPNLAEIVLRAEGGDLVVTLIRGSGAAMDTSVMLARIRPRIDVTIEKGENAGRTITYHNVVTDLSLAGRWNGKSDKTLIMAGVDGPAVVFLQSGTAGPVIAAAQTD
ncbi:DUF1223 domain-containing protein [Oceanibium sediminis]|uniref:DUF1223 domain-containing protein n=1 Tax=Oceanibium sediminis TaxID=2026339 RepID=UPI000DD3BE29|nr:DUF1223 domain-containing protein [Oceanibium sediminis]